MPPLVTTQPTWPSTGPELPGTAPKPSPPPPTWSPSSGASSSPPNIGQVTPANRPQQKSMPSSWPGMQQRHNRESRVKGSIIFYPQHHDSRPLDYPIPTLAHRYDRAPATRTVVIEILRAGNDHRGDCTAPNSILNLPCIRLGRSS